MIHLEFDNIEDLKNTHFNAVLDYVEHRSTQEQDELFNDVTRITGCHMQSRPPLDYSWLRDFILADVTTLEDWVCNHTEDLKFQFFKRLYLNRFANKDAYVDSNGRYNAYTLLEMMDIKVCPYCDDEQMDILHPTQGDRRTCDFDHFYPKSDSLYPALAMCFYNLIPSGKGCNSIMLTSPVAANPYHTDIENWSHFECDIPLGANLEALPLEDFSVRLKTTGRMGVNNATLDIEGRYNRRKETVRKYLRAARDFEDEKIEEMLRLGIPQDYILRMREHSLGNPYPADKGRLPHQKLRHDLTGY